MVTPYLPYPPVSGGRSRTYNLVRELQGHADVDLLCFGRPEERAFDLDPLRELCDLEVVPRPSSPSFARAALLSATSPRPVLMRLYTSPAFREALAQRLATGDYDVVHVESFYLLQNLPDDLRVPVLLSEPAIEYVAYRRQAEVAPLGPKRLGMAVEARKFHRYEPREWRRADLIGAMSEIDAEIIGRAGVDVTIVPNGVDVDFFRPRPAERDPDGALYMGDYSYFPNVDAALYFVREILPLIRARRPGFTLTLLGKDPPPELRALGPGVEVTGLVEDTRPYLARTGVFVCPLRSASGTRFKLLEAMACECPVVSTTVGAEGLGARDGEHLLAADDPQAFGEAILRLVDDRDLAGRLGREAGAWIREEHGWRRSAELLLSAYRRLAPR